MSEEIPREFLVRAYNNLRKHYWSSDIDLELANPIRGVIIRAAARDLLRRGSEPPKENPPNSPRNTSIPTVLKPIPLDNKRLASGEREDD